MVRVPKNTFVAEVEFPMDKPDLALDGHQYTGWPLNVDSSSRCPKPFSNFTGDVYCPLQCFVSCPELNPDQRQALAQSIAQNQLLDPYISAAVNDSLVSLSVLVVPTIITGNVSFPVPMSYDLSSVVKNVQNLLKSQVPALIGFPTNVSVCFD